MGLFSHAGSTIKSLTASPAAAPRSSQRSSQDDDRVLSDTEPDDTSILDEDEGSIIASLISQLRVGMDLSRVTFPTFVLEPRSMLERITDFMSHPDLIFGAELCNDPEERFIRVLQYYLAGWHIKPKGVKKPYNPVLGEFFRCRYEYSDGSYGYYIAEQVSHHPPVSAFFYISPANKVSILGELRPKSKFLGNSVSTQMEGENRVRLLGKPEDGEYVITMPNMYAKGIVFGKMVLELGDTCMAKNEKHGLYCDLEFKRKGFFSGEYNELSGKVRRESSDIGEVFGRWSHVMHFKSSKSSDKRVLFDAVKDGQTMAPKWVPPESEQEPNESQRLWSGLTRAILDKDMEAATSSKSAVEDAQREQRRHMEETGKTYVARWFVQAKDGRWEPKIQLPTDPEAATKMVAEWIFPSTNNPASPTEPNKNTQPVKQAQPNEATNPPTVPVPAQSLYPSKA